MPKNKAVKNITNAPTDIQTISPNDVLREMRRNNQVKVNSTTGDNSSRNITFFKKFWGKVVKYIALATVLMFTATIAWGVNNSQKVSTDTAFADTTDTTVFQMMPNSDMKDNVFSCLNNLLNDCTLYFSSSDISGIDVIRGLNFVKDLYASADRSYYTLTFNKEKLPKNSLVEIELLAKPSNQVSYKLVRLHVLLIDETVPPLAYVQINNGIFLKNPITNKCELTKLKIDENARYKKFLQETDCTISDELPELVTNTVNMCYNSATEMYQGDLRYIISSGKIVYIDSAELNGISLNLSKSRETIVKESLEKDSNFESREYVYQLNGKNIVSLNNSNLDLVLSDFNGQKTNFSIPITSNCN